jgi:uncharacterized protein
VGAGTVRHNAGEARGNAGGGTRGGEWHGGERGRPAKDDEARGNAGGGTRGAEWHGGERGRPAKDDDGTMYNPFAEAFRKMKDKDGKK